MTWNLTAILQKSFSSCTRYAKDKDSSDSSRIYYEASFVEACNRPLSIGLGSKFEDYVAKLNADIEKHLESLYQAWGKRWEMIGLLEFQLFFVRWIFDGGGNSRRVLVPFWT